MTNKGLKYLPRLTPAQVIELRERYVRGETPAQLSAAFARPYDTVLSIALGRSYKNVRPVTNPGECQSCAASQVALDNVALAHMFRGRVRCMSCRNSITVEANQVHARQGRILCGACAGGRRK